MHYVGDTPVPFPGYEPNEARTSSKNRSGCQLAFIGGGLQISELAELCNCGKLAMLAQTVSIGPGIRRLQDYGEAAYGAGKNSSTATTIRSKSSANFSVH